MIQFLDIHVDVHTREDRATFIIFFHLWLGTNSWLATWWSIRFSMQFSKQLYVHIGDSFQRIHRMYVVPILMVSTLKQQQYENKACVVFGICYNHTTFHPAWQSKFLLVELLSGKLSLRLRSMHHIDRTQEQFVCLP